MDGKALALAYLVMSIFAIHGKPSIKYLDYDWALNTREPLM
jgi:hypothetical protein